MHVNAPSERAGFTQCLGLRVAGGTYHLKVKSLGKPRSTDERPLFKRFENHGLWTALAFNPLFLYLSNVLIPSCADRVTIKAAEIDSEKDVSLSYLEQQEEAYLMVGHMLGDCNNLHKLVLSGFEHSTMSDWASRSSRIESISGMRRGTVVS